MKKIIFSIAFILPSHLFAQEKDPLSCPIAIPEYTTEICADSNYFENQIAPIFFPELSAEFEIHLKDILFDNQIHPQNFVPILSTNLKTYNNCLQDICNSIQNCNGKGISNNVPLNQYKWCKDKTNKLFQLHKTKLEYTALNNSYRKTRSIFEEKVNRVGYLFSLYIHQGMKANLILLHKTKNKINNLIPNPQ